MAVRRTRLVVRITEVTLRGIGKALGRTGVVVKRTGGVSAENVGWECGEEK